VVFDDKYSTVPYMEKGSTPPHWEDLVKYSSEMATKEDYNIAETWLQSNQNNKVQPTDNPVVDPFDVVSDQHNNNSQLNSGKISTQFKNLPVTNTLTCSAVMANEKDRLPNQSTCSGCALADTAPANALMSQTINGTTGVVNDFDSNRTTSDTSANERSMPTRNNLRESGLCRLARIAAQNATKTNTLKAKAHVAYGIRMASNNCRPLHMIQFCFKSYDATTQSGAKYVLHRHHGQQVRRNK